MKTKEVKLFGIEFTMDPQKTIWNLQDEDSYVSIKLPETMEEVLESIKNNQEFNFYKSLDIDNIHREILAPHPSTHAFWTKSVVRTSLRIVLDSWLSDPKCQFYKKQPMKVDNVNLQDYDKLMAESQAGSLRRAP